MVKGRTTVDETVSGVINSELPEEDAARLLKAIKRATNPAVGTVLRNTSTGDIAVRVRHHLETYWRVVNSDDLTWTDFNPLNSWVVLLDPSKLTDE
jgi:hypothetical protein